MLQEVEENIYWPDEYDTAGCPTGPLVFAGENTKILPDMGNRSILPDLIKAVQLQE